MSWGWDERDIRHQARLMAYLWADEPGLADEFYRNSFVELIQLDPHPGKGKGSTPSVKPGSVKNCMKDMKT